MDNWRFFQDASGLWAWQHTASEGVISACSQHFSSRTDCIVDAMRNGYLALKDRTDTMPAPASESHIAMEPAPKPGEGV
jgi:hypothetical protein